jgi:hypothetical protein
VPDPINLKRLTGQGGQRQGGSYDLPAAFHVGAINVYHLETTLPDGQNLHYHLLSLPLYLVGQVRRLIRQWNGP